MALLTVRASTALSPAEGVQVKVELTDGRGDPVVGFDTTNSALVAAAVAKTDATGEVVLDLVPNADILPSNTYYTVTVGSRSFLIEKSGVNQTLQQALVGGVPLTVGPLLTSDALLKANNLSDLNDASEARDNLGLGDSATRDVGTVAGTVAAGDDPRFSTETNHNDLINRDVFPTHPADSIEFTPFLTLLATDVQSAIEQTYTAAVFNLDEADEISFAPAGTIAATNVQDAIEELDSEIQPVRDHLADPTDAHDASAISLVPSSPFTAVNVQGALDELFPIIGATPIHRIGASATVDVATAQVTGDPEYRFVLNADGNVQWGDGSTPVSNTFGNLRKNSTSGGIKTDAQLAVAGGTIAVTATTGDIKMRNVGTIKARNFANDADIPVLTIDTNDDVTIGANSTDNVFLATGGTNRISVNDGSSVGIRAGSTRTLQISDNTDSTTSVGGIFFGQSADTNLYRSAANTLKTDDAFVSAVSLSTPFIQVGASNFATAGVLRSANDGQLTWRNFANTADIPALWVNTANDTVLNAATGENIQLAINGTAKITVDASTITLADAQNFVLGTTTGTKFGSSTAAKLGFWGATPIVRPSSTGESAGRTAGGGGTVSSTDTFTGNVGTTAYTLHDIVKHLKNIGLIAA